MYSRGEESIQLRITSDKEHHRKVTKHKATSLTREQRGHPLPAGDHKAVSNIKTV